MKMEVAEIGAKLEANTDAQEEAEEVDETAVKTEAIAATTEGVLSEAAVGH